MGNVLWIIVVLLVIGWIFGFLVFPAIGGIIHILLVIAVIMIIYQLLTGRKV
ncbi:MULTISPECIES: lmo0937 family membrane protein [Aequorivita]|uniref:Lmo0937 family membrane protein n=1 Tax=Aequorivita iocasae TaxID=2803865 RepID=A0ABX7DQ26_9FLAO|nr:MULTISPECIES: lmo0937 family membrane protein [Aequorivita]QQX76251.1 lmo0937 family membrane protein [Aequorivita iocasae]UCA55714.1 lmo0937 family membrane protein [Aequorivita sp. F7]